jgi:hypothetical protein
MRRRLADHRRRSLDHAADRWRSGSTLVHDTMPFSTRCCQRHEYGRSIAQAVGITDIPFYRGSNADQLVLPYISALSLLSRGILMTTPDAPALDLLVRTLQRFVDADAQITDVNSVPLRGGMSGAAVWRHSVRYSTNQRRPGHHFADHKGR